MPTRHFTVYFSSLLFLLWIAGSRVSLFGATKARSKTASLYLMTDRTELTVSLQGSARQLPSGQALRLPGGWQEFQVAAAGTGTRTLRVWLADGETREYPIELTSNLRPQIPLEWRSADRILPPKKRPSLACEWFRERHAAKAHCERQTWEEELQFSEPDPFDPQEMRELETIGELFVYRQLLSRRGILDLSSTQDIETFYARHASLPAAFRLASHHSLLRGDCPRVHSIFIDGQQALKDFRPLVLYKAFCAELQGQQEAATSLLRDALALQVSHEAA
jgi:hypothetical protein